MATMYNTCPNICSKHGNCGTSGCICNVDYSGPTCEIKNTPLVLGQRVPGYSGSSSWNYYHFIANTINDLVLTLTQTQSGSDYDCDLYARELTTPNLEIYDYKATGPEPSSVIRINSPGIGQMWFFGIFGLRNCYYDFVVTEASACTNCSVVQKIDNNVPVHNSLASNEWSYYNFTVNKSFLSVHLLETRSVGNFWLFLSARQIPNLHIYDYSDKETNSNHHVVNVYNPQATWYIIGVYGSPFGFEDPTLRMPFVLEAYQPPF